MQQLDRILTAITRKYLGIETLNTRRSDSLDFHNVAVWQLQSALEAAFKAGVRSVRRRPLTDRQLLAIDVRDLLAKRQQVAIAWSIEDVQQMRPDLNDDQAWEVLRECRDRHDCELGLNWQLIDTVAENLYPPVDDL